MVSRLGSATAIAVLSTFLLAACDSAEPPKSSRSTAPTTSSTPPGPAHGAPGVDAPLDGAAFADDPCTSLTPAQLTDLKLSDPQKSTGDNADQSDDGCTYVDLDPATDLFVYVNYYPDVSTGLGSRYAEHAAGQWVIWSPTEVAGYPAVTFRAKEDPTGCFVDVGISNTAAFNIKYFYYDQADYDGRDTCAAATTIATAVLSTIKAAG